MFNKTKQQINELNEQINKLKSQKNELADKNETLIEQNHLLTKERDKYIDQNKYYEEHYNIFSSLLISKTPHELKDVLESYNASKDFSYQFSIEEVNKYIEACQLFLIGNLNNEKATGKKLASVALLNWGMRSYFKYRYYGYISSIVCSQYNTDSSDREVIVPMELDDARIWLNNKIIDSARNYPLIRSGIVLHTIATNRLYPSFYPNRTYINEKDTIAVALEKAQSEDLVCGSDPEEFKNIMQGILFYYQKKTLLPVKNIISGEEVWSPQIENNFIKNDLAAIFKSVTK